MGIVNNSTFVFNNGQVEFSFSVFVTVFPLYFFLNGYNHSKKCNENNRRLLTLIYLAYLFAIINTFVGYVILAFNPEMPEIGSFLLITPMIVFSVIVGCKVFPEAYRKVKAD